MKKNFFTWFNDLFVHQHNDMTAETAYSISSIGECANMASLQEHFLKRSMFKIKDAANNGLMEVVIRFPQWMNENTKEIVGSKLTENGYYILYADENILLVSWRLK